MSIPRTMFFLDAENLVFRYQAMLQAGRVPRAGVVHVPGVFVWHSKLTRGIGYANVSRVYLYTSMVGDDDALRAMRARIAAITYEYEYGDGQVGTAQVVPVVYKKSAQRIKSRQVDINIAIDVMRFAHNPSVELLVLASGDGDFIPLVQEAMRHGKEFYVAAFSSGLAEELCHSVDEFLKLDGVFFEPLGKAFKPELKTPESAAPREPTKSKRSKKKASKRRAAK